MDQKTIRDKLCNDFPSIYIKEIDWNCAHIR